MSDKEKGYTLSTPEQYAAAVEARGATQPDQTIEQGICLWTDGSCIPNPGFGGWGLHGYLFKYEKPKKGSGNPDHILSVEGYMAKNDPDVLSGKIEAVTPLQYIDGFGSYDIDVKANRLVTNNLAEIDAAYNGLVYAQQFAVKSIRFFTDSEYVRKGITNWTHGWKKHGWRRSTGEPIPNVENWRRLYELVEATKARGISVEFDWVKAHSDILGNVKADRWAMIGTIHSLDGVVKNEIQSSDADGYWSYTPDRHPFISHQMLYFNTRRTHLTPGEYYLGNSKDDDQHGTRSADGAFAVIRLTTPDPVIEALIDRQADMADNTDNLMKMVLGNVYKPEVHKELSQYGHLATYRAGPRYDLEGANDEPLTSQYRPARLAYRAVENIGFLADKLDSFLQGAASEAAGKERATNLVVTDLTPILYETVVKTVKKESTEQKVLKDQYTVGFAVLDVMASYMPATATGELAQAPLKLTLGIDLLDRNGLRRLEKLNPKISLVTWIESEIAFRHATVIEVDGAVGIWAGMYSNIRVISDKAAAPVA